MMHALVTRTQFHGLDVASAGRRDRDDEIAIHILPAGRESVRLRHLNDQVRLAELPALAPFRRGGQVCRCAFHSPFGDPLLNKADLINAEVTSSREFTEARLWRPRRHKAALSYCSDVSRMFFHLGIGQQIEWRRLARSMTI